MSSTITDSMGTMFLLLCLVMSASAGLGSFDLQDKEDTLCLQDDYCGIPASDAGGIEPVRSSGVAGTSILRARKELRGM